MLATNLQPRDCDTFKLNMGHNENVATQYFKLDSHKNRNNLIFSQGEGWGGGRFYFYFYCQNNFLNENGPRILVCLHATCKDIFFTLHGLE